jgi:polyphosphate kinase 2 (PPK2 family)
MNKDLKDCLLVKPNSTKVSLNSLNYNYLNKMDKEHVEKILNEDLMTQMSDLQYKLFADKSQALLIILQGISGAGKDSTIRSVMMLSIRKVVDLYLSMFQVKKSFHMIICGEFTK